MKKKVLFICHGGTICMNLQQRDGKSILVAPKNDEDFRLACQPSLRAFEEEGLEITYEFITSKDSTNITFQDWTRLCLRIEEAKQEGYHGVAITHGTDIIAHTATALALALAGINPEKRFWHLPVVMTGAQTSIHTTGGDARFNLENLFRTLIAAMECCCSEVLINFSSHIFRGCRAIKTSETRFDAISSPAVQPLGVIDSTGVQLRTELMRLSPTHHLLNVNPVASAWGTGVIALKVSPGLEPATIESLLNSRYVRALILESLGDANICNEGDLNLIPVIRRATEEMQVPVFLSSSFNGGNAAGTKYELAHEAINAGAIPCFDHTQVAVDVKVRWLLGNHICSSIDDFRQAMRTSFAGEVTPPKIKAPESEMCLDTSLNFQPSNQTVF